MFGEVTKFFMTHTSKKFVRQENEFYVNGDSTELYFEDEIMQSLAEDMFDSEFASYLQILELTIPFIFLLLTFVAGLYGNVSFFIESFQQPTFDYIFPITMGLIVIGVSVGLLIVITRWLYRQIVQRIKIKKAYLDLRQDGRILQGEVQEVRWKRRGKKAFRITSYAFTNPNGNRISGKFVIREDINLSAGDNVHVLYLNDSVKILL